MLKINFENQISALFEVYFWPFNKCHEKIKSIFVISAIIPSIWNVFIKFRWHDEKLITGHVIYNQAYIIFIFSPIKIGGISDCLLLRRRFWILTILNKVQHCKTIITLHQQLMATLLNQDLLRLFDQEIKGMWTGFLKILLQSATRIKYRPKKTKVKKNFGSIFYGGKTSFFRAKNLSVSTKTLWSVVCSYCASTVPKNLGVGENFWPCSEDYFLSKRP